MTTRTANTLWGRVIADELAAHGTTHVCIAPGSRSTPVTAAISEHDSLHPYSFLDERSAAFFALGRGKRTGRPTPVVSTSGTAPANFHPAVIEAHHSHTPLLLLTADRPRELQDSGANQTIDQTSLYGPATRWTYSLPEPTTHHPAVRALRTTIARAITAATGIPPGPVHLNLPFRKPLEPTTDSTSPTTNTELAHPADTPEPPAASRPAPYTRTTTGHPTLTESDLTRLADTIAQTTRGLIVAGPTTPGSLDPTAITALAHTTGYPVLADPLSGLRYGPHTTDTPVCGGYDAFLDPRITRDWPTPDVVLRLGRTPTSAQLADYLARTTPAHDILIDPAGQWHDPRFTATHHLTTDPTTLASALADHLDPPDTAHSAWQDRFLTAEHAYWDFLDTHDPPEEGRILHTTLADAPDPATIFIANSMPIRDADRFGKPQPTNLTLLGNRGASGIDGNTSTGLGAGSTTTDPLVIVLGDLAFYHDMNGLLAITRCSVDATIVLINNDGGGIFHMLPIEAHDPPFTPHFKTPHGLDFTPTSDLYDTTYTTITHPDDFPHAYTTALNNPNGGHIIEVTTDAERNHHTRETLQTHLTDHLTP